MLPGHVSLPNGLGLSYPKGSGRHTTGVAPNELTASEDRDPIAKTPWHKHVKARVERGRARTTRRKLRITTRFSRRGGARPPRTEPKS